MMEDRWFDTRTSLFDDLREAHDMLNSVLEDWIRAAPSPVAYPSIRVWQSDGGVIVDFDLPGIDPKKVDVTVEPGTLTVRGKRSKEESGMTRIKEERYQGEYSRTIRLPFRVEVEQIVARYKDGVLRVTLPRAEAEKPRVVTIETA